MISGATTNAELDVNTDYTVTIEDETGILDTQVLNALATDTAVNTHTFLYADLWGAGAAAPPIAWAAVTSTAGGEDSPIHRLRYSVDQT